jgi:hypothetical protein
MSESVNGFGVSRDNKSLCFSIQSSEAPFEDPYPATWHIKKDGPMEISRERILKCRYSRA